MALVYRLSLVYLSYTLLDNVLLKNNRGEGIDTVGTFSHSGSSSSFSNSNGYNAL